MFNSALVIGVGGTGRWVLTQLRSRLLADAGTLPGEAPQSLGPVRLLSFDLDNASLEFAGHGLDTSETFIATSNFADVVRNIKDYPDASKPGVLYKDVREWISPEDAASYGLAPSYEGGVAGAGQLRQRGRLGIVQAKELHTRIVSIVSELDSRGEVNVYVTGSLAGGTGSATLFDVAAIVHSALGPVMGTPRRIVGVFVLPAGLRRDVNESMFPWLEACSYASIRELDRFQRRDGGGRLTTGGRVIELKTRLFDVCYLADGVRDQQTGGVQDVVNTNGQFGVDAAAADLIYGYLHPVSGAARTTDQPNVMAALDQDHPFKFSKFGSHTVWSPLPLVQRSLVLDDAADVLAALTSQPAGEDVASIVSTPKVVFVDADGANREVFNAPAFLGARRYLDSRNVAAPRFAETLPWLLPADPKKKAKVPERPDYANREFPDIKWMRTPYANPEVKQRVDQLMTGYQMEVGRLTEAHRKELLKDFRLYLLVQCQEIARGATARALGRARRALVEIEVAADNLAKRMKDLNEAEAKSGRLNALRVAYKNAQIAMDDNRTWDDAGEQRDLFDAAIKLLDAELDAQGRASLIGLLGELSMTIADVRDAELNGWLTTLETLAAEATAASAELDRVWADQKSVVVRRILLDRHSGLETATRSARTEELRGDLPEDQRQRITSPATAFTEQRLAWVVGRTPGSDQDSLLLRGPWESRGDRKITLALLIEALADTYKGVLDTPFGEALKHSGITPGDLAAEIKQRSGLLAASSPEALPYPQHSPRSVSHLFGPWGDGTEETAALRAALTAQGLGGFEDTLGLIAADERAATGVQLNQSVWTDVTFHGATGGSFSATYDLKQRYMEAKTGATPLHIFPDEEAAVAIEKRIDELVRERKLASEIDLLGPEAVVLAARGGLIRQIVLLLAAGRLTWTFEPLDQLGAWTLTQDEAEPLIVATGPSPAILLPTVVDLAAHPQEAVSETFLKSTLAAAHQAGQIKGDTRTRLEALANGKSDIPGLTDLDSDLHVVLQVACYALLR